MSKFLKATHEGKLPIGEIILDCAVLEDGTRIIKTNAVFKAFNRIQRGNARLTNIPVFVDAKNLQPFIDKDLMLLLKPIIYFDLKDKEWQGYNAIMLPLLCDVYLTARAKGKILTKTQLPLAAQAEILVRSLSKIGIIALVDEATGYENKDKDALRKFLNKFLLEEHAKYIDTYPDEFFEVIFKMKGWTWNYASTKKPQVVGHYINNFVYSRLAPSVLTELKIKNPTIKKSIKEKGYRKYKHTQFINSNFGHPLLKEHLHAIIALVKGAGFNWINFQRALNRAFPKYGKDLEIDFKDEIIE